MDFTGLAISPMFAATDPAAGAFAFIGFGLAAVVAVGWAVSERQKRLKVESQAQQMRAHFAQQMQAAGESDAGLGVYQKQIAELTVAKLKAEVALLEAQLKAAPVEDRIDASKEAHELMVEKTKLEIDGLRLHNTEARRRIDDWRAGD